MFCIIGGKYILIYKMYLLQILPTSCLHCILFVVLITHIILFILSFLTKLFIFSEIQLISYFSHRQHLCSDL